MDWPNISKKQTMNECLLNINKYEPHIFFNVTAFLREENKRKPNFMVWMDEDGLHITATNLEMES